MAEPIRVGIIGANPERGWALTADFPGLLVLPEFEVSAVATTSSESAKATAERFGVPHAFADGNELIRSDAVDLVSVVVKVPDHFEYLKAAIVAGKHVYCEWPLGTNLAQAAEVAALANAAGVLSVVGLQGRASVPINYVRDLVADGYVGDVLSATLTVAGAGWGGRVIPEGLLYAIDKENGLSTLSVMGGHNIDAMQYCVGELAVVDAMVEVRYPEAKVAETGVEITVTSPDVVLAHGRLESGAYTSINVQGGLPKGRGSVLEIQGSDGALILSGAISLHVNDDATTLQGVSGAGSLETLVVPDRYRVVPDTVPAGVARNIAGLYLALADALENGTAVDPDFTTAASLHQLLDAIERASVSGSRQVVTA